MLFKAISFFITRDFVDVFRKITVYYHRKSLFKEIILCSPEQHELMALIGKKLAIPKETIIEI